ncbi:X2-like carbohydrate binding domain-containing protein [Pseudactinotalea suaedae]|uniref:X2-like carbohydrate binding domain-containing protein n=1 Tax=Pseudactinotalea suaedae TaxID=1524924 RepID=UPI0019D57B4A|nr:X2-like carbohydrate binding domain-containing protein [Pseudactinotalea suaedae]
MKEQISTNRRRLAAPAVAAAAALMVTMAGGGSAVADNDPPGIEELAQQPYMGWSSYSMQVHSGGQWITADQLIAQSDAMHETLQPHGYTYINVDAGWNGGIDEHGRPVPSQTLYPDGLQAVIDHVHDNGQKFGLYFIPGIGQEVYEADLPIAGAPDCSTGDIATLPLQQGDYWGFTHQIDFTNPCAQAYIDSIADLIGDWGVDFVKFDSVTPGSGIEDGSMDSRGDVAAWSQALARHDIWLELSWAVDIDQADYWAEHAQGWRVDWDVECYCGDEALTTWANIERLFPRLAQWWRHAGPDRGWNDLDSLNVGNGSMDGLTRDERRTAMTLWAVSAAPLYIGNDMTDLDEYGIELLTNDEVIAVNQAAVPARPVATDTTRQVWYALNPDGTYTVALFNLGRTEADMTLSFEDLGLSGSATVRDLWAQRRVGTVTDELLVEGVPIHGARLFTVTPGKDATITVNDDDLRVDHQGDWNRNGGSEVVATSQPLTIAVADSSTGEAPTAPEAGPIAVNDDDPSVLYQGSWSHSTGRGLGDHEDDVHFSESAGNAVEYTFVGTGIDYVTETHSSQGDVEVYLDGQLVETVSTYQESGRGAQQVVYSVRDLPSGTHTLRLVHATGQYMLIDRLDVVQETLIEPSTAAFDRALPADLTVQLLRGGGELAGITGPDGALVDGTDYVADGGELTVRAAYLATLDEGEQTLQVAFSGDHLDDVHATTTVGDAVEISFRGERFTWSGPVAPDQGEVEVWVDGDLVEVVDTHGEARLTGQELFTSQKLRDKQHTVRLVMVSGEVMRFDTVTYTVKKIR